MILTTLGDAMRGPGNWRSLMQAKAGGADIRMVCSPLDALELARRIPAREVVCFGPGCKPADLLQPVRMVHRQIDDGAARVKDQDARVVPKWKAALVAR